MKAAILDATENGNSVPSIIKDQLSKREFDFSFFKLENLKILPCRSCGACGVRTPGRCLQKDDMSQVMQSLADSRLFVYITPIKFGGYSSQLKKAIDRTQTLGEPLYIVKRGHLLHPMRYGEKFILAIGLSQSGKMEEEENFRLLVSRNAMNMQSRYKALVFHPQDITAHIETEIEKALGEVR